MPYRAVYFNKCCEWVSVGKKSTPGDQESDSKDSSLYISW